MFRAVSNERKSEPKHKSVRKCLNYALFVERQGYLISNTSNNWGIGKKYMVEKNIWHDWKKYTLFQSLSEKNIPRLKKIYAILDQLIKKYESDSKKYTWVPTALLEYNVSNQKNICQVLKKYMSCVQKKYGLNEKNILFLTLVKIDLVMILTGLKGLWA